MSLTKCQIILHGVWPRSTSARNIDNPSVLKTQRSLRTLPSSQSVGYAGDLERLLRQ
jgi:hypothetical protein